MRFSAAFVIAFAAYTIAAPVASVKRAAVLSTKTYDEISISGGTAGNAEAEALAVFSALDLNDMANGMSSHHLNPPAHSSVVYIKLMYYLCSRPSRH